MKPAYNHTREDSPRYPCPICYREYPMTEPNMEWDEEFVEKGADIEHDRWARWQKYMFSKGVVGPDGVFHLPEEFVDRWFRQIDTPYSELSESEKESDRKETRNYLSLIRQAISEAEQRGCERGAAEERRRIVAGLDNGFEEYMVKKADVLSLIHDNK